MDIMKKVTVVDFVRNIIAGLLFFSGLVWFRLIFLRKKHPLVRVLLIHHVRQPEKFAAMISIIARDYHPISLDDFIQRRFDEKKINILLTLDDGYASWYKEAVPILEKYNVPALFFISSGFIESGKNEAELEKFCKDRLLLSEVSTPLSKEMLVEASKHPLVTIGGHSQTHPFFETISIEDAQVEIVEDKKYLEELTGREIKAFAFPYGRSEYKDDILRIIKDNGYQVAFTTHSDFYNYKQDIYLVPRSNHGTVSPFVLRLWIMGAFDLVQKIEDQLRKFLRR
jgi:peptidoglycan/xylan/chitin deacetylase (PgdA/CDA1 family)